MAKAVGDVDASIGEFVRMMDKRRWIEGSEGDAKRPGAYCTMFSKSRAPRVYLSAYNGSLAVRPLILCLPPPPAYMSPPRAAAHFQAEVTPRCRPHSAPTPRPGSTCRLSPTSWATPTTTG